MPRTPWNTLPPAVVAAVETHGGQVRAAHDAEAGNGSDVAAHLYLDSDDGVFVKGAQAGSDHREPLERERAVAAHTPPHAPRLLWTVDTDGWLLLGYEFVHAELWADFPPGHRDVRLAVAVLDDVGTTPAPPGLPDAWERWGYWCDPSDESLFAGDRLVHGDPAAVNFLVSEDRAWLVDWAWAMRGPAWIDPMLFGFRLVLDGGHTPEQAADVIRSMPGYPEGTCRGRQALTRAEALAYEEAAAEAGDDPEAVALATAARTWADHWASELAV